MHYLCHIESGGEENGMSTCTFNYHPYELEVKPLVCLHQHTYRLYASNEGSGKSSQPSLLIDAISTETSCSGQYILAFYWYAFAFKDIDHCPIEIIKGLTDKGQFQYLTKLMGPQEGTYLYTTQFHSPK